MVSYMNAIAFFLLKQTYWGPITDCTPVLCLRLTQQ